MEYRNLGKSGLKVSELSFGSWVTFVNQLNQNGWELDKTLVEPTIRQITQQLFGRQFRVLRTQ